MFIPDYKRSLIPSISLPGLELLINSISDIDYLVMVHFSTIALALASALPQLYGLSFNLEHEQSLMPFFLQ
jgi:hypothetical protein